MESSYSINYLYELYSKAFTMYESLNLKDQVSTLLMNLYKFQESLQTVSTDKLKQLIMEEINSISIVIDPIGYFSNSSPDEDNIWN